MHYFKNLYIFFAILALIIFFFSTTKVNAKAFQINNIEISTPFEKNFSKNKVIDIGFKEAFLELLNSIIQTKDLKKIDEIKLSEIKSMIESFSIKEEKFVKEIYYMNLGVSFDKKKIYNYLEKKNIFPAQIISETFLFIPIIIDEKNENLVIFSDNQFYNNWNKFNKKSQLINYLLPTEDLEDLNLIKSKSNIIENYDFKEIIKKYNLKDYIITIIFKNDDKIRVLNKINFNDSLDLKNLRFQNLRLNNDKEIEKFTENLKIILENYWKSQNEINTSVKLPLTISINNNDSSKISEFEEIIANIDLIYNFYIFKFNNTDNIYKIIFNGSPDYFLKIMKNNKYEFDTQNQIWKLK